MSFSQRQLQQQLELMERFCQSYGQQFAQLIDRLNAAPTADTARQCLHLCVETLNMMLSMQMHLAGAMRQSWSVPVRPAA